MVSLTLKKKFYSATVITINLSWYAYLIEPRGLRNIGRYIHSVFQLLLATKYENDEKYLQSKIKCTFSSSYHQRAFIHSRPIVRVIFSKNKYIFSFYLINQKKYWVLWMNKKKRHKNIAVNRSLILLQSCVCETTPYTFFKAMENFRQTTTNKMRENFYIVISRWFYSQAWKCFDSCLIFSSNGDINL